MESKERFYTAEHVLDLVRRVYNIQVLVHKSGEEFVCNATFPTKNGMMTMANGGKDEDHYDCLYMLLYKIAQLKESGKLEGVMQLKEGEGAPIDAAIDLLNERRIMEPEQG